MTNRSIAVAILAASVSPAALGGFEYEEVFAIPVVVDGAIGNKVRGLNNSGQLLVKAFENAGGDSDIRVYDLSDGSFVTVPEPVPFITSILGQLARCALNDDGDVAWDTFDPAGAGTGYVYRWSPGDADSELVDTSGNPLPVLGLDNSDRVWMSGALFYDPGNVPTGLDNPPGSAVGTYPASNGALAVKDGNIFSQTLKYWSDPAAVPVSLDSAMSGTTVAVNESGEVAWSTSSTPKIWHAADGSTDTIPVLAGMTDVRVDDMNADGWVIGTSSLGPWIYRDGVTELVSDLTGFADFVESGIYQRNFIANDGTIVTLRGAGILPEVCTVFALAGAGIPGDINGDGSVGFSDLTTLLASWGPCEGCPADLDGNGNVGLSDLLIVLAAWGA